MQDRDIVGTKQADAILKRDALDLLRLYRLHQFLDRRVAVGDGADKARDLDAQPIELLPRRSASSCFVKGANSSAFARSLTSSGSVRCECMLSTTRLVSAPRS